MKYWKQWIRSVFSFSDYSGSNGLNSNYNKINRIDFLKKTIIFLVHYFWQPKICSWIFSKFKWIESSSLPHLKSINSYYVKRGPHLKSIFIYKTNTGQFAMSHGSYDLKLDSEIFILAGQEVGSISVGHTVVIFFTESIWLTMKSGLSEKLKLEVTPFDNGNVNGQFHKV